MVEDIKEEVDLHQDLQEDIKVEAVEAEDTQDDLDQMHQELLELEELEELEDIKGEVDLLHHQDLLGGIKVETVRHLDLLEEPKALEVRDEVALRLIWSTPSIKCKKIV